MKYKVIPITLIKYSILLVKMTYFGVVSFVKGTIIYINLCLKLSHFSVQNLEHLFNIIAIRN